MARYLPKMHVLRDNFVHCEEDPFDVVSVLAVLLVILLLIRIPNASSAIEVKKKQLICLFVHQ